MKQRKLILSLLSAGVLLSAQSVASDYIHPPVADQVADLSDDDKDGVINARDKCANTIIGSEVDNVGCGTQITEANEFELKVLFDNNSHNISPAFINEISQLSAFLNQYPETSIELQGYASRVGSAEHNLTLSEQRAKQVKQALINVGIQENRIKIVGYGDTVVIQEGNAELDHALNRRVSAKVVGYDDKILEEWHIFSRKGK